MTTGMPQDRPEVKAPAGSPHARLLERICTGEARVGIIGLGYVGLPLAQAFAARGIAGARLRHRPGQGRQLQRGQSYIGHIRDERSARCWPRLRGDRRFRPAGRGRRHHHLRADAADRRRASRT